MKEGRSIGLAFWIGVGFLAIAGFSVGAYFIYERGEVFGGLITLPIAFCATTIGLLLLILGTESKTKARMFISWTVLVLAGVILLLKILHFF